LFNTSFRFSLANARGFWGEMAKQLTTDTSTPLGLALSEAKRVPCSRQLMKKVCTWMLEPFQAQAS